MTRIKPIQSPPPRLHVAVMIWLAVFPTIAVFDQLLRAVLTGLPPLLRTLMLVSMTVPVVVYVWMPLLQRLRARLLARTKDGTT